MFRIINVHDIWLSRSFTEYMVTVRELGLPSISDIDYYVDRLNLKKAIPRHKLSQKPFIINELPKIIEDHKEKIISILPKRIMVLRTYVSQSFKIQRHIKMMEEYFGDIKIITVEQGMVTVEWHLSDDGQYAYLKFLCAGNVDFEKLLNNHYA